jgi:hypothetical protein
VTRSYGLRVAVHGASVRPSLMRLLADAPSIHLASLAVAAPGLPRLLVGHSPGKLNVAIAPESSSCCNPVANEAQTDPSPWQLRTSHNSKVIVN